VSSDRSPQGHIFAFDSATWIPSAVEPACVAATKYETASSLTAACREQKIEINSAIRALTFALFLANLIRNPPVGGGGGAGGSEAKCDGRCCAKTTYIQALFPGGGIDRPTTAMTHSVL
jgi:hypothetical protein